MAEDTELTHVGPDTPCGEYMRRFWQPLCYADDLKDVPRPITLLDEELVVFRNLSGEVGLLIGTVPIAARRWSSAASTPRAYAAVTKAGSSPSTGPFSRRLASRRRARSRSGSVTAPTPLMRRMASSSPISVRPIAAYDSVVRQGHRAIPGQKYFYPCNWLQIMENAMDPHDCQRLGFHR